MPKAVKIYWDACAFIGLLNGEPAKKRELQIIYNRAVKGEVEIWTSTISLIEVHRLESENNTAKPWPDANEKIIAALFNQKFVKPIPVDVEVAERARIIYRTTPGLKNRLDAVHLASAIRWNIGLMHTYDRDDLLHLSRKMETKNGTKLEICYPDETTDGPLFAAAKGKP